MKHDGGSPVLVGEEAHRGEYVDVVPQYQQFWLLRGVSRAVAQFRIPEVLRAATEEAPLPRTSDLNLEIEAGFRPADRWQRRHKHRRCSWAKVSLVLEGHRDGWGQRFRRCSTGAHGSSAQTWADAPQNMC